MGIGTGLAAFDRHAPASVRTTKVGREIKMEEIVAERVKPLPSHDYLEYKKKLSEQYEKGPGFTHFWTNYRPFKAVHHNIIVRARSRMDKIVLRIL